ncbi:hypothetical protein F5Y10DRAFT_237057 [Nemania abortiva]|nr:hypothetical protein F5Y10DRAFT_237057 [Nemania abortiva]
MSACLLNPSIERYIFFLELIFPHVCLFAEPIDRTVYLLPRVDLPPHCLSIHTILFLVLLGIITFNFFH